MHAKLVVIIATTLNATERIQNVHNIRTCMTNVGAPVQVKYGPDPANAKQWLCERGYFVDWKRGNKMLLGKLGHWMSYIDVMEKAVIAYRQNTSTHTLWIENDLDITDDVCREAIRATNADDQQGKEWYTCEGLNDSLNLINNRNAARFLDYVAENGIQKPLDLQVWGSKKNVACRKFKTAKPARKPFVSTITTSPFIKTDSLTKERVCEN